MVRNNHFELETVIGCPKRRKIQITNGVVSVSITCLSIEISLQKVSSFYPPGKIFSNNKQSTTKQYSKEPSPGHIKKLFLTLTFPARDRFLLKPVC